MKAQTAKLEDMILDELGAGPKRTVLLVQALQVKRSGTTKQGIYAALRNLRAEEKVVVHGGHASLSTVWLHRMIRYFTLAQHRYLTADENDSSFLNLADGERVSYHFRDAAQADAYWSHVFDILNEVVDPALPFYLYNPHEWFLLARRANERLLMDKVTGKGRQYLLTVGGRQPLDRAITPEFDGRRTQCHFAERPLFAKGNYYLNIIGDYLIEVYLDPGLAERLEAFYRTHDRDSQAVRKDLRQLISQGGGRTRLILSRNARKAARLTRQLRKFFY